MGNSLPERVLIDSASEEEQLWFGWNNPGSLDVDSQGNLWAVYVKRTSTDPSTYSVFVAHSQNYRDWIIEQITNVSGEIQRYPCIAIDKNSDTVYIAWTGIGFGNSPTTNDILFCYKAQDGWQDIEVVTDDVSSHQNQSHMIVDNNGNVHLVWGGYGYGASLERSIEYRKRENGIWSSPDSIHVAGGVRDYPSITIDSNNVLHVVWIDNIQVGGSRTLYYTSGTQGSWSSLTTLDTYINTPPPKIAVDSNNNPHVTWKKYTIYYTYRSNDVWEPATSLIDDRFADYHELLIDEEDNLWLFASIGDAEDPDLMAIHFVKKSNSIVEEPVRLTEYVYKEDPYYAYMLVSGVVFINGNYALLYDYGTYEDELYEDWREYLYIIAPEVLLSTCVPFLFIVPYWG